MRLAVVALAVLTANVVFLGPSLGHPGNLMEEDSYKRVAAKQIVQHAIAGDALEAQASAAVTVPTEGPSPCVNGMSAGYECDGVDMLSRLSLADLGLTFGNDIWGWTDPETGKDYALMGGAEGTTIVDITQPANPDIVGMLPTQTTAGGDFWRDIKVYQNHMYVGSENTGHGIQVFDLTQVRGVTGAPVTFSNTARYDRLSNSHNLHINEATGYLYAVGATGNIPGGGNPCLGGGLHMIDISSPASPEFAGCFAEHGYIHDTQCIIYDGPDAEHQGSEICFNSNPDGGHNVSIVDVSDKANPVALSRISYENTGYSHQGWLTPDRRYFLHGDELDETGHGIGTTTRVWNVTDLDDPVLENTFENDTTSIDHNMYTEGNASYHSNYTSGLRIYDNRNLPALTEERFFDVYPQNDNASFEGGTWSNYPYFAQNNRIVAVSSIDRGLFVLRVRG